MDKNELNLLFAIIIAFSLFYFMPVNEKWFEDAVFSSVNMLHEYAVLHILTCLVPAFFIAGAINSFISKQAILNNLSEKTNVIRAYITASLSGAILAVCSCTIIPLFAAIHKRGAGIGPASTFLFSGPAINISAIFLTFSVLGFDIGFARAISSIMIAILIGVFMSFIFKNEKNLGKMKIQKESAIKTPKKVIFAIFALLVAIIVINGFGLEPNIKMTAVIAIIFLIAVISWFKVEKKEFDRWMNETWSFSKTLVPVLFVGVFFVGFVTPLIPQNVIVKLVGDNTLVSNIFASMFGALMYFSTLTEIPILQTLINNGMHKGPALALLLAGPSLSLPSILMIRQFIGTQKTFAYVSLVIIFCAVAGFLYGLI